MERVTCLLAVAAILLGTPQTATLTHQPPTTPPILLGAIDDAVEFGDYAGSAVNGQSFVLTYQTSALLPNPEPSLWPFTYCIGCDNEFPLGWTGVHDFSVGPSYAQFLSNLGNRVNDGSVWQLSVLTSSGKLAGAFGSVADEYDWFAPRSGLDTWTRIDFVRLRVVRNAITINHDISSAQGSFRVRWEFWGSRS